MNTFLIAFIIIGIALIAIFAIKNSQKPKIGKPIPMPPKPSTTPMPILVVKRTPVKMGFSTASFKNACKNIKRDYQLDGDSIGECRSIFRVVNGKEQIAPFGYYSDGKDAVKFNEITMVYTKCGTLT